MKLIYLKIVYKITSAVSSLKPNLTSLQMFNQYTKRRNKKKEKKKRKKRSKKRFHQ